ncbi:cytochrome c551 [Macrococcus carouselicus]|uniref:Cytochrome c n=1 Tax=Macrococcus carouselicus TaxID=69969 RepID=A0A9Q8FMK5_9STAP|nr:cytochrome c [Macrococcus carouselicus]TDM03680.1 cytochrome c [Macrococcus carouselicus]
MKKMMIGTALAASMTLAACGNNTEETKTADNSDPGLTAYQNHSCVGCHGKNLEGASGPNLAKVGAKYSKEEIADIIKNGKGNMPSGQAQGEDVEKIADYLSKQK